MENEKRVRMQNLVEKLNLAGKAYYAENREIMSNLEYDKLYDELCNLEEETGVILVNSPTINVGYESVEELPKDKHEKPMLSLGKTKSRDELVSWIGKREGLLSWKLDGLTVVLTYNDGKLAKAVTRGSGLIGEVVTNNAKTFKNVPLTINFKQELILRGEAVITYSDFERINEQIEDVAAKYKNPRNLCSGSVRQLNSEITAQRSVRLYAFTLVKAEGVDFNNSLEEQYQFLEKQGFDVVEYKRVTEKNIKEAIEEFETKIENYDIPSDGLVLAYDDIEYGKSLGTTAKTPKNAIAFKWADELKETKLLEIEWSPSRTGLINPVAVFEPVELEGTTVSKASVHNISIMKKLKLGIGDTITVYKANMIIPQIAENITCSDNIVIPEKCPVCGGETQVKQMNEVQSLYCMNSLCTAKKIKAFTLFVSRDAMNIDGLSEATLEKFISKGFIHQFADIFHLDQYENEIIKMEGFGEKSYKNLADSINKAKETTLPRLIYALGIENIGIANAKMIVKAFNNDLEKLKTATEEEVSEIDKVGDVIAGTFCSYFADNENMSNLNKLLEELIIIDETSEQEQTLEGMNFVITGSLEHYDNRKDLQEVIESKGGKVTGSVTGKTTALINNVSTSNSSKNKKAKELDVKVLTEEEFIQMYL